MRIEFQTNVGRKRKSNQDTVGVFTNQAGIVLALVADGMGGHLAGDKASQIAVAGIGEVWQATHLVNLEEIARWLTEKIQEENDVIYAEGNRNPEMFGMGTTIVAAAFVAHQMLLAHVGDSRAYLVKDNRIKQLTDDHSLVNELVKTGEITTEMAENHPKKNILIRSVGVPGQISIDRTIIDLSINDYVLLCSDGLTNMLSDVHIGQIINSERPLFDKVTQLIEDANLAGGTDNITVLLIKLTKDREGGMMDDRSGE